MKNFLFSLLILCLSAINAGASHGIYEHSVLVVHSYHPDMQWVKEVHQGIENTLKFKLGDDVDIMVEFMNTKRLTSAPHYALITELWRHRYRNNLPDVIIVCDDNALNHLLSIREELFKNIPLIFCGINFYDPAKFASLQNITGVVEAYDLPGTLDIIKRLFPNKKNLFIINDQTTTGNANKSRLEEIAYDYSSHLRFIYSGNLSVSTLKESVASLEEDTAILLMSFNRDADGQILRYRDAVRIVRENSSQPIFGVWSFYLGKGIVGGSLVNGISQGRSAAELCVKILHGTPADSLPVITKSPNIPMFDYRELQRFAVERSLLPLKSKLVNTPETVWYQHKHSILLGIFLLTCQTLIIALLVYNVSMRRRSQQNLLRSQQNLSITLEAIGEGVISVDPKLNIVRANTSAAELLELSPDELPGRSLADLLCAIDPEAGSEITAIVRQCCKYGKVTELPDPTTLKLVGREGPKSKKLSGICSAIRDHTGNIVGAVLICRDITERESMRAMLAHSQKMEAIGQLAGGVAHDFNNLLTGISGFAEILSMELQDDLKKAAHAQKILNAAGRAKDLTRQLLSFARKGKIVSSPVDLHEALHASIDLLERSIGKNIILQKRLEAAESVVMGDPIQLENIFLNLGINGADAMEDGGTLTFTTSNLVVEESIPCELGEAITPGFYICVSVRDDGCGITKESQRTIFEPFFTTKRSGKGTGLGLSAVFGAMKEHGGKILLFSEVGEGTDFQLYFPLTEQKKMPGKIEAAAAPRGQNETILVIDDESLVLSSAEGLLNALGYRVIKALGGEDGIKQYKANREAISLVLLDMIMPGMDGFTCFSVLKEIDPAVKVIISSGFAETGKIREIEKMGVHDFLQKPYTVSALGNAIHSAINTD